MLPIDTVPFWVLDDTFEVATLQRLGDARRLAGADPVGVLLVVDDQPDADSLIAHGADHVVHVACARAGQLTKVSGALKVLKDHAPKLLFLPGHAQGRQWAAHIAVRANWRLVSPALMVQRRGAALAITALDRTGRLSRPLSLTEDQTAIVTMRAGVGEAIEADPARRGQVRTVSIDAEDEPVTHERFLPADPATVDIRFAPRLVAGGRGLGRKEGFAKLNQVADRLGAAVAASRVAVDLGWIDSQRQVGQTGRTVKPDLYIACGISGASHHLAGMSESKHIVAINTDPQAPIFKAAHLGLVADLHDVLGNVVAMLESHDVTTATDSSSTT